MLIQLEPGLSGQFRSNPSDPRSNQSHGNLVSSKLQYLDVLSAQNSLYKHPLSKSLSVCEQDQKPAQNKILKIYSSDQYLLGGHENQVELLYHGASLMFLNEKVNFEVTLGQIGQFELASGFKLNTNRNLSVLSEFV